MSDFRVIVERISSNEWSAWFHGFPLVFFTGELPSQAIQTLLECIGGDTSWIQTVDDLTRDHHLEFDIPSTDRFADLPAFIQRFGIPNPSAN